MRDSMVFYRSFYEAIKDLPAEQLAACFRAIMDYALDGIEPEGSGIEKTVFILSRPQIDTNNKKYEAGKKGGRPTKEEPEENQKITKLKPRDNQSITKEKPSHNQAETKEEPNVNANVNDNDNVFTQTDTKGEHFPDFWRVYPKQTGEQMAVQCYLSLLHSTPGLNEDDLIQAAKNYAEACTLNQTNSRYIKNPSNWLSDGIWMDYLPGHYKRPEPDKPKATKNRFNAFPQRGYTQSDYQSMEQRLLQRTGNG